MDVKIDKLKQIIPEKYILSNEPMKKHTTFRIGGPADIFMNSSTEPDQMMGGIRNVNLQEQQWHLVCNDPLSGLDRCKKAKM